MNNQDLILNTINIKNEKGLFSILEIIEPLIRSLLSEIGNDTILSLTLFGSYIKGTATSESDIDLCLIYKTGSISELEINFLVDSVCSELLGKYGVVINILCFSEKYYLENKDTSPLLIDICNEGVLCKI